MLGNKEEGESMRSLMEERTSRAAAAALYCATPVLLLLLSAAASAAGAKIGGGGRHCRPHKARQRASADFPLFTRGYSGVNRI